MLGRTLVPLTFNDRGKEIVVRDIKTLKEVFKKEFYTQLVAYLHNKRLERFFFALGMDEIKETIENLRSLGKSDLEVINKVAELMGVEPISVELSKSVNFAKRSNLLQELSDTDQNLTLVLSSYFLRALELELKGSKVFRRETAGNTELAIAVSKLKGSKELVFENLIVVMDGEVVFEGFEKAEFRNVRLRAENPMKFINTSVELYGCEVVGCLWLEDAKLMAESSEFHDSSLSAIYSVGSSVVLKGCKIAKNKGGTEHEAQVRFINSEANLVECEIAESEYSGLISNTSKVSLIGCKIYESGEWGIVAKEKTELNTEGCDIYGNGASDSAKIYQQISILDSTVHMKNSQIHNSKGQTVGLYMLNSKISLIGCKIYENGGLGIGAGEKTKLHIEGCDIYGNGASDSTKNYPQFLIQNSTAYVKNSQIHNSKGTNSGLLILNSKISLIGCKIYENGGLGIGAGEKTELHIEGCDIYGNGASDSTKNYPQFLIQNSTAYVKNSQIHNSKGKSDGVYASNSNVSLIECKVYENSRCGICASEKTRLNMESCSVYKNGGNEYTQVFIEDSRVVIDNSEVYESKGIGIAISSGAVLLYNVKTYGNKPGVYKGDKASLAMYDCNIRDGVR